MPSSAVRDRIVADLAIWQADGIVAPETGALLAQRYEARSVWWLSALRAAALLGGLLALAGLLGIIAAAAGTEGFGGLLAGGAGVALLVVGMRMATDPMQRQAITGRILLGLGFVASASGLGLALHAFGLDVAHVPLFVGLLEVPLAIGLAHRARSGFLLVLALLMAFHWVGSWTGMSDRSTYDIVIDQPRLMALATLPAIGFGAWLAQHPRANWPRCHAAWLGVGLTYLNISLLILSIVGDWDRAATGGVPQSVWIALFTVSCVLQIILGARLHNGQLTGFGVTFAFIDLYTRFHEQLWARLDAGLFFLLAGALLFAVGAGAEWGLRRRDAKT